MKLKRKIVCRSWIYALMGILMFIAGCKSVNVKSLQSEVDKVSAKFVPDQRMTLCKPLIKSGQNGEFILSGETTDPVAKSEIIKTLDNSGIIFIDSLLILPDTIKNSRFRGIVSLSVINLRRKPDHAAELVSQAIMGTPVLILKRADSWLLVQTPDKYIAWTTEASVIALESSEFKGWKTSDRIIYLVNTGWIYDSPSDKSQVIGDLVGGSILIKTGESGDFAKVSTPDGRNGFVEKNRIMSFNDWKSEVQCSEENICSSASTFMGLPYLWGGSSAKGVDCSGLVQSVFFRNGLILQRDASLQAQHGAAIDVSDDYKNLEKGDLLFFGTKENNSQHVTHVGIYVGNKEYINSSGMVKINSLDSTKSNFRSYKQNSLLEVKRIVGVTDDSGIVAISRHPWY